MVEEKGQTIILEIESELANTTLIAMAVRGLCGMTTLSSVDINRMELCVVEVVNNSMEHAYNNEKGHRIQVDFCLMKNHLTITVSDWGRSMDKIRLEEKNISTILDDPSACLCSGRGLLIVQSLMDEVDYQSANGKNNFVMTKRLL